MHIIYWQNPALIILSEKIHKHRAIFEASRCMSPLKITKKSKRNRFSLRLKKMLRTILEKSCKKSVSIIEDHRIYSQQD